MKLGIPVVLGLIGFFASGPIGALIGALIGVYIEYVSKDDTSGNTTGPGATARPDTNFANSLLILIAATMNADGNNMKSELDLVKRLLVRTYGEDRARDLLLHLRELLKQRQDVGMVCRNIRLGMAYSQRLELLHILFRISRADSEINAYEIQMLNHIAVNLGISSADYLSLKAMFVVTADSDYQILDIQVTASEEEVKKAYRSMAKRFHPDRLTGLSDAEKKAAEQKFVRVQGAYENIKRKKGWP